MTNLKNYRISLKFSEKDAEQSDVAKLLKQLGRKKSAFITKAVKYYLENNPSPEIPGNNNILTGLITENIIKATILKMIQSGELSYNEKNNIDKTISGETKEDDYIEKIQRSSKANVSRVQRTDKVEESSITETIDNSSNDNEAVNEMLDMLDNF